MAEDMSSEKYCFTSSNQSLIAKQKLSAILVPSDVVSSDDNCLVIQMRPHRRELIQRFVLSTFPGTSISFSSEDVGQTPCRLKVEKMRPKSAENLKVGINQNPTFQESTSTGSATETMQIQTTGDFELSVDQDQIHGKCRYITANRYEIRIMVKKSPKPLNPAAVELPPGTIVVTNTPLPDQEMMLLETQIQLSQGEKIELGEVVKNLKSRNQKVDIKPNFELETDRQTSSVRVYLSLE
jgi:hypothetical protein